jgi:O-antigen ligase
MWSQMIILYGVSYSALFVLYAYHVGIKIQPEVMIFFVFIIWSVTGLQNVLYQDVFMEQLTTIFQIGVLIYVISGITSIRKDLDIIMFGIAVGGVILVINSYLSGEFLFAFDEKLKFQVGGLTGNANQFSYQMLFIVISMLYFIKRNNSIFKKALYLLIILLAVYGVIASGSRQGFIGFLALIALWFYFCQRKKIFNNPLYMLILLILVVIGVYYIVEFVISSSYLGFRLKSLWNQDTRYRMYLEGFDLIKDHPILGIGLDHYRYYSSSGMYSHSDYIEVAASTGIVGFIIYFSIYFSLWRRLSRLQVLVKQENVLYNVGLIKASLLTILILAFTKPHITSKPTWIFLAAAIGYTWSIERENRNNITHSKTLGR